MAGGIVRIRYFAAGALCEEQQPIDHRWRSTRPSMQEPSMLITTTAGDEVSL